MAGTYRPVITREEAKDILTALEVGMQHAGFTPKAAGHVLHFMSKLSEREQMATILERLGKTLPDIEERGQEEEVSFRPIRLSTREIAEANKPALHTGPVGVTELDDEELQHFIWINEEKPELQDMVQLARQEQERREVRKREQNPPRITPPSS